ncbi:MAG: NADH-quinone oxidoreductase subunit NuoF [Deltaproteobacteria bacterium]|nr:MAG: NADH-quinone oxidoreductase subunit NuoF [Deltaproteobacteria bacterium]
MEEERSSSGNGHVVLICQGTGCESSNSEKVRREIESEVEQAGLTNVKVSFTGCHGFCEQGPIAVIEPEGIFYTHVKIEDAKDIVHSHLKDGKPVESLFYKDPVTNEAIPKYKEINFYKRQKRLILRNCGHINPENITEYIATGGYEALKKVLSQMSPEAVIDEIKRSGIRGRGGAGFPTGVKWEFCKSAPGNDKYLICNADEGDPGAFMDRSTMEGDPHTVIEGMIIAAYAIGANQGYIYCRAEYPLAVKRMRIALKQAEEGGFLGENILNSDFSLKIKIKEGAGAFVCGEETALMASIEGKRGMPRPRPPFPAQSGLWGKPSNINNVKTLSSIPVIIKEGAEWYASIGNENSKGTAVFALTGKVANSGLVEVPMGTTLREIIFDIGGGILGGKKFKAVQTGGPSGGCLPANFLDSPVDFETLAKAGSIMGSGGMVVLDEDTCMVDVAKYFLSFTMMESCGKCIPCRWGNKQLLDILEDITNGRGKPEDIDLLIELSENVKAGSLCGLGQTSPNPVLSTIRYFRDEYESHIMRHHCSAVACKGLVEAPCSHTCPAGVDAPRYIRLIANKKYDEALAVIRESIPFPAVCGYVCFHPCETKCRRGLIDEPIAIKELKRFAADHAKNFAVNDQETAQSSGKNVAVVGSGPAGLTAAYYLAKRGGHAVTVFEALPKAGGMMRVGIPRYRLPDDILDAEIDLIKGVGVEIITNTRIESLESLRDEYDAIFLSMGAHTGIKIRIPGEDCQGVIDCVNLLREVSLGKKLKLGDKVAVIGGGNAAIDASRTALRIGANESTILYRRTREEMPAAKEEIKEALNEGVKIEFLIAPKEIHRDNGHLRMKCLRMKLGEMDSSGRRRPVPITGSEFERDFDVVISAIGQVPEISEKIGLAVEKKGVLHVDPYTLRTEIEGVFAGGDVVSGPASVIEAIAAGKRAAIAIDKYLGGEGIITETLAPPEEKPEMIEMEEEEEKRRPEMPRLSMKKRFKDFSQVELGLTPKQAIEEANRCLRCDLEED